VRQRRLSCRHLAFPIGLALFGVSLISPSSTPVETLYREGCGRCHDLPSPSDHSSAYWAWIMPQMAYNARLSKTQATALERWLKMNSKNEN
jgi:hypothetical protein